MGLKLSPRKCSVVGQGCTNPGHLVAWATKVCTVEPDFSA